MHPDPLAWMRSRAPHPSKRVVARVLVAALLATMISTVVSTWLHLRVPAPTGGFAVGKQSLLLEDSSRDEPATSDTSDHRIVRLVAWYPAIFESGRSGPYLDDLDAVGDGLEASGSIGPFERAGLGLVSDAARLDAGVATAAEQYPAVILSPGNATNVEFYASLAEDLASHGYVVFGIDHPYQSAAVDVRGRVAIYAGDPPMADSAAVVRARIDERVDDIGYVLDRLAADAADFDALAGRIDLDRIGVMGHSNGGLAAVAVCDDPRVRACANLDGQNLGGPFGTAADPVAPANPFLFLTKEADLHSALADAFEVGGLGSFRVVIPAAEHDSFTDGPRFRPRLVPMAAGADDVMTVARGFTLAFFEHTLKDADREVFGDVNAPTDVLIEVYPLRHDATLAR